VVILVDADQVMVVDVKGGIALEVAPSGREGLGAGAIFGGEEGDNLTEEAVEKGIEAVFGQPFRFCQLLLLGHGTAGRWLWKRTLSARISPAHTIATVARH
jgi:hypothetical protein